MVVDSYSVFVNMFAALDAAWEDGVTDESLRAYLSESSPYTFEGEGSADPAVWAEFRQQFLERFQGNAVELEDSHAFIVGYLKRIGDEYVKAYQGEVPLAETFLEYAPLETWLEVFESTKR